MNKKKNSTTLTSLLTPLGYHLALTLPDVPCSRAPSQPSCKAAVDLGHALQVLHANLNILFQRLLSKDVNTQPLLKPPRRRVFVLV